MNHRRIADTHGGPIARGARRMLKTWHARATAKLFANGITGMDADRMADRFARETAEALDAEGFFGVVTRRELVRCGALK